MAIFQHKTPLSHLSAPLSPFARELCYGVCRHHVRLVALAQTLMQKRPKQALVEMVILLGLYQLHFLNHPPHAVVHETVSLIKAGKLSWARGLVNGVLREYCRQRESIVEKVQQNPAFIHGHPIWLVQRIQRAWPNHWEAILRANDQHPPMSLRVNAQFAHRDDYLKILETHHILAHKHRHASCGITLDHPCDITQLPGFLDGSCSVQDEAAQLAVSLLDLKPGLSLLDACCAPGGKTTHCLEQEPKLSACIALDLSSTRLQRVADNLKRLKLQAHLIQGDALLPEKWWKGDLFDRILLDAPCSATGVIRRHPDIKCLRTEVDIEAVIELQAKMLQTIWTLLKPGGRLVYATCSIVPAENQYQIEHFITNNSDARLDSSPTPPWALETGNGWQILPGEHNMDGFFYAVIHKKKPDNHAGTFN